MKLPKKLNLGFGNVIRIEEVSRTVIQSAVGKDVQAAWSVDVPEGAKYVGVILIDAALSAAAKEKLLYHELVHAVNDLYYWATDI